MRIRELIADLPVALARGDADAVVCDITEDSRMAVPGSLFIARQGMTADGREYIPQAADAGSIAVLCDDAAAIPGDVAAILSEDVPLAAALLAERFCGDPSRALTLIGVTGTNGKTTTAHLIHLLLATPASAPTGLIGTVHIDDGTGPAPADLTTPPAITLSRHLKGMVANDCRACVMEVSSHALDQQRVAGLNFDIAVFTNLSGDHMDYHGSVDAYVAAKAKLFAMLPESGTAIVNVDDETAERMLENCSARIVRCSLRGERADCSAVISTESITHVDATFLGPWGAFDVHLPLCGRHNVMNALQAAAVAHTIGVSSNAIGGMLEHCTAPPGRLDPVTRPDHSFAVYVDYAHTDDALDNVLRAVKPLVPDGGRLHVVFGCGGDRDRTKRPRMAAVAARYADRVYVTSDNPRTEDPQRIVDEVMTGVPEQMRCYTESIVDRREAIHAAIRATRTNDVVLIAGKGHEDYQIIGTMKRPFDDRQIAHDALESVHSAAIHASPTGSSNL